MGIGVVWAKTAGGRDLVTVHGRVVYRLPRDVRIVTSREAVLLMIWVGPLRKEDWLVGPSLVRGECPKPSVSLEQANWPASGYKALFLFSRTKENSQLFGEGAKQALGVDLANKVST